jgi:hypothetical protein
MSALPLVPRPVPRPASSKPPPLPKVEDDAEQLNTVDVTEVAHQVAKSIPPPLPRPAPLPLIAPSAAPPLSVRSSLSRVVALVGAAFLFVYLAALAAFEALCAAAPHAKTRLRVEWHHAKKRMRA